MKAIKTYGNQITPNYVNPLATHNAITFNPLIRKETI